MAPIRKLTSGRKTKRKEATILGKHIRDLNTGNGTNIQSGALAPIVDLLVYTRDISSKDRRAFKAEINRYPNDGKSQTLTPAPVSHLQKGDRWHHALQAGRRDACLSAARALIVYAGTSKGGSPSGDEGPGHQNKQGVQLRDKQQLAEILTRRRHGTQVHRGIPSKVNHNKRDQPFGNPAPHPFCRRAPLRARTPAKQPPLDQAGSPRRPPERNR